MSNKSRVTEEYFPQQAALSKSEWRIKHVTARCVLHRNAYEDSKAHKLQKFQEASKRVSKSRRYERISKDLRRGNESTDHW